MYILPYISMYVYVYLSPYRRMLSLPTPKTLLYISTKTDFPFEENAFLNEENHPPSHTQCMWVPLSEESGRLFSLST